LNKKSSGLYLISAVTKPSLLRFDRETLLAKQDYYLLIENNINNQCFYLNVFKAI
jgi:hypothetical protein